MMTGQSFSEWLRSEQATRELDAALAETSRQMVKCGSCHAILRTGSEPAIVTICERCSHDA